MTILFIFLPKINKVFLSPILQNLVSFEIDPLEEPKKMPSSKKFYLFSKMDQNRIYPSFRLQNCTLF